MWLPLVRECLSGRGFRNIAVDADLCHLTAEYGGPGSPGGISIRLSPSSSCGETDVVVVATASLRTERFVGVNKMIGIVSPGEGRGNQR